MKKINTTISFLLISIFLIGSLASCSSGETTQKNTYAETVFEVVLNEPLVENELLYLEVLDEVTGIALNPTRYEMEAKDNYSYFIRIPMVIGSVVKYRYVRQGTASNIVEHNSTGQIVQYRVHIIKKASVISDFITGWDNKEYAKTSGSISGYIYDEKTDTPLSEIMVFANGQQTTTMTDGYYEINNIPLGEYDLVAVHPDGRYKTFQQGAVIAENSITPASFGMEAADMVEVTFIATPPENETTSGEVRFISNLYSFGNTYSEQSGSVSVLASNAPVMELQSNGDYSITLELPEDFDLQYKYSLGDGFINAEHAEDGSYKVRQYIVPGRNSKVRNNINSWFSSGGQEITFNVSVPDNTPEHDIVSIQFNPFVWMEPIPMQESGNNKWTFTLYGPLEYLDNAQFRFCRNNQCGLADDALTSGKNAPGYLLKLSESAISEVDYSIDAWAGMPFYGYDFAPQAIPSTHSIYFMGVELDEDFDKKASITSDWGILNSVVYGTNLFILTPTWTTSSNHMETKVGSDMLLEDWNDVSAYAEELGLTMGLYPQPRFDLNDDRYWDTAPFSYNWWHTWFDRYERYILKYAEYAENQGIQTMIIGGSRISPAFPYGKTSDGNSSNTPYDFEDRWNGLIDSIRSKFSGQLFFALSPANDMTDSVDMLAKVDALYVELDSTITESTNADVSQLRSSFSSLLDGEVYKLYAAAQKPVIIGLDYASVDGSAAGCLKFSSSCEDFIQSQDNDFVSVDLIEQAQIYQAAIEEAMNRNWIYGLISKGYNPSVSVNDNSASIQDKPASIVVAHYFNSIGQ